MNETSGLDDLLARHVAALLCADPPVLAVYDSDFAANRAVFAGFARKRPRAAVLVQLGWQHETDEAAGRLADAVAAFRADAPASVRVVALANCPREQEQLATRGVETRFVHQNAFLDERRYRPIRAEKRYDAVYLARLTPFKRHVLIPPALAPRLLCIGCQEKPEERDYADGVRARLPGATWIPFFSGAQISRLLARARCGLALSAEEGACFASAEYLLCGLPVVDTPALGGRAELYPEEFVASVDAAEDAVGAAVERWRAAPPDPWRVRAAFLARVGPHRAAWRELMRELTGRTPGRPPHKLGIRTPHPGRAHTLAIALLNRLAALAPR